MKGVIFNIQRCSLQDGPGIRTTVFIKGCPLRCVWCHNPESWHMAPELSVNMRMCVSCGRCVQVCPSHAHKLENGVHVFDRTLCAGCGACVPVCAARALSMIGRTVETEELVADVLRDRSFFERSGGGVTLSGGEPMMQFAFTFSVLQSLKEQGIHVCLDTCGYAPRSHYEQLMPYVDIFLFDYKATEPEKHRELMGVDNALILDNLHFLLAQGAKVILRCPMVERVNDTQAHLEAIAALEKQYSQLLGVEIMAYHNLGKDKGLHVGRLEDEIIDHEMTPEPVKERWIQTLRGMGSHKARIG